MLLLAKMHQFGSIQGRRLFLIRLDILRLPLVSPRPFEDTSTIRTNTPSHHQLTRRLG